MREKPPITFQGRDTQEHFQFYFRQHWMRMLWPGMRMLFATLLFFGIAYGIAEVGIATPFGRIVTISLLLLFFLAVQWQFLQRFYGHFLNVIIITDQKIHRIKKTLFSQDDHQTISLWALQEMKKSQRGPIQNIFGFGSIILEAQDTQLRLHFVPRITHHYGVMLALLARAQQQGAPATKAQ